MIELVGDIDRSAEEGLDGAYAAANDDGPPLLDFTATGYINSTGIALIVGLLARASADRRELAAFGLSDHYHEIFSITRLVDFMTIYRTSARPSHGRRRRERTSMPEAQVAMTVRDATEGTRLDEAIRIFDDQATAVTAP